MVHFRLDPEKFLSLDEAWKRTCSRLGRYDEKAGRADEALARRGRALIDRSADLERRGRDLRKRIADETITADERAAAEAELTKLAAVDHELAAPCAQQKAGRPHLEVRRRGAANREVAARRAR
jgi:hypothetical protein